VHEDTHNKGEFVGVFQVVVDLSPDLITVVCDYSGFEDAEVEEGDDTRYLPNTALTHLLCSPWDFSPRFLPR
jgi:hypothetical protein